MCFEKKNNDVNANYFQTTETESIIPDQDNGGYGTHYQEN